MIKNLLLLSAFLVTISVTRAQSFVVTPTASDTLSMDTSFNACSSEAILIYTLQNNTPDTLQMNWRAVYSTFPHAWTLAYCYQGTCLYSGILSHTFTFKMFPGTSSQMQLDAQPTSGAASGNFQVFTWATNDSANTATFLNYKVAVNACTVTGISEVEAARISLYPNPVRNELTVSLPQNLDNGRLDIYNLLGSKVYSQPLNASKDFNVSALEAGIYVARISDGGGIVTTRKFTKSE
jgi:hypothetical protein